MSNPIPTSITRCPNPHAPALRRHDGEGLAAALLSLTAVEALSPAEALAVVESLLPALDPNGLAAVCERVTERGRALFASFLEDRLDVVPDAAELPFVVDGKLTPDEEGDEPGDPDATPLASEEELVRAAPTREEIAEASRFFDLGHGI